MKEREDGFINQLVDVKKLAKCEQERDTVKKIYEKYSECVNKQVYLKNHPKIDI